MRRTRPCCALLAAGISAACGASPDAPAVAPSAPAATAYHVQIGDQLAVRLYLTPELNEDVMVRPDGRITTQLAEAIPAAGCTPEQVAAALRTAYAAELKDPRLTVEVKQAAPQRVYVAGEVVAAGEFTTTGPPLTLLQAVARAGGLRTTGDADRVLIVRRGGDSRPAVIRTRYADAFDGRDASADLALQPFDVVVVPRSDIAEVYVWVNQHIQQFVPVSWGFSYNVSPLVGTGK